MPSLSASDPWGALHVNLLPLFNGEPLRVPIEDLNQYVKQHIAAVVALSPSRSVSTLENDTTELLSSGMVTLNAKLNGVEDDKLVGRVVDRWGFFWDQVLTYVEGVLLPLQNDPLLTSLSRKRPSSPRRQASKGSISGLSNALMPSIDIRTLALRSFRDKIILPLSGRLYTRLAIWVKQEDNPEFPSRLHQMLLVLSAQARSRPPASLTAPPPLPTPGETAVNDLLRIIRSPRSMRSNLKSRGGQSIKSREPRAPSFLSGGVPRDRRGRIAMKIKGASTLIGPDTRGESPGEETPRNNVPGSFLEMERERGREILESLKSPDIQATTAHAISGGWGLDPGKVGKTSKSQEDNDFADWDQAQAAVEEMIGMDQGPAVQGSLNRRRMT